MELPNTKIRSVAPDPTDSQVVNVVNAWSGGTVDTARSRLLVWGGGHNDYYGNEMYALDLPTLSIQRIIEGSPVASAQMCDGNSAAPDGTPESRHTYDGLTYIAHADRFFSVGGALAGCGDVDFSTWTYDFGAKKWTKNIAKSPVASGSYGYMAVYDPATKLVYVEDTNSFLSYNYDTNAYTTLATGRNTTNYTTAAIDTKRRKYVMVGHDGVKVIDLSTYQMTTMATTNTPSLVNGTAPGLAYDPVTDRIVAWNGGSNVYALNMDTGAWTQVATGAGPTASPPGQGTYGRWGYIPQYRVFALINSVDQNAWVFRLSN